MKEFESYKDVPKNFTGVCKLLISKSIRHYKNGKYHNENGPAEIYSDGKIIWFYKGEVYGYNNQFTVKSWKEKVENLKREEELKIFI